MFTLSWLVCFEMTSMIEKERREKESTERS
jgi:hypothetical protein